MRLEPLCTLELAYREESLYQGKFVVARPYDSKEASAYGEGDGWVKGEKLQGTLRWVNHPHCRTDGVWLPNLHGVIQTEDGASILFSLQGRTKFMADGKGHQLLNTIFGSDSHVVKESAIALSINTCVLNNCFWSKSWKLLIVDDAEFTRSARSTC